MPKVSGEHAGPILISGSDRTWTFERNFSVFGNHTFGMIELADVKNNTIILHGTADASSIATILLQGKNTRFEIGEHGRVSGPGSAIHSTGKGVEIINEGVINGADGVFVGGANSEFRNFGTSQKVEMAGENSLLVNEKGGTISSIAVAVTLGSALDGGHFINHGKVEALTNPELMLAINGNELGDIVVNDGKIIGGIDFGGGNDTLDNRGGKINGLVSGGLGNDTLITDKATDMLAEFADEGRDTVRSTVTYALTENVEKLVLLGSENTDGSGTSADNSLIGNKGNNLLKGNDGLDTLDGGAGNDMLKGGADGDLFVFKTGHDKDTIALFEQALDHIDISGWKEIKSFNAVKSHAENHGDDVWITAGDDILMIKGIHKADLDASDFGF